MHTRRSVWVVLGAAVLLGLGAYLVTRMTRPWHPTEIWPAETYALELKRLPARPRQRESDPDSAIRGVDSQYFWVGEQPDERNEQHKLFSQAVKKQPAKYACSHPFRGVAKLAAAKYAFVLDSDDLVKKGFHRLYFDFNCDGDLTNDRTVEAKPLEEADEYTITRVFPCVEVKLDVDGMPLDYAFSLESRSHFHQEQKYASASLRPIAYREATVSLGGKSHRIVVVDYDCNGRFDDVFKVDTTARGQNSEVYSSGGDLLLVDPQRDPREYYWDVTTGEHRQQISKLANVDGRFYDIKVSPTGDKIALVPSKLPLGMVTNPNERFRAVVYSDHGLVKISGEKGRPVELPEGDWRVLSYCIDASGRQAAATRSAAKPAEKGGIEKAATATASVPGRGGDSRPAGNEPRAVPSRMLAAGTWAYKAVQVRRGRTAELPFGPPYRAIVKVSNHPGPGQCQVEMSVVGSTGEICRDLEIKGERPGEPIFAIAAPDGEIVERGKFEWG